MIREYADDEANTETMTVLQLHVGRPSSSGRAIHWHADPTTRVEYVATDHGQQTIPYVQGDRRPRRGEGVPDARTRPIS